MQREDCPADAQDPPQHLHNAEVKARLLHVGARRTPDHEGQRILLRPLWQILDAPFIAVKTLPSPNVGSLAPGAMLGSPGSASPPKNTKSQSASSSTAASSLMDKATALGKSGGPEPAPPLAPVFRSVTLPNKFANYFLSSGCACSKLGGKPLATGAAAGAAAALPPELPAPEPVAVELAGPETAALWASCTVIFGTTAPGANFGHRQRTS